MPGHVVWFELWVADTAAARAFYAETFGWSFRPMTAYDPDYWLIDTAAAESDGGIGGAICHAEDDSPPSTKGALVYLAVDDLHATCDQVEQLGGQVDQRSTAINDGTYFAIVRDPFGTRLGLWSSSP